MGHCETKFTLLRCRGAVGGRGGGVLAVRRVSAGGNREAGVPGAAGVAGVFACVSGANPAASWNFLGLLPSRPSST